MKNPIGNLNKVFDSRIRMGVMSILLMNAEISFNDLKQLLELTDGNLASHLINLEENGFIKVHKGFIGRKTNTTYSITRAGEKAELDPTGTGYWEPRVPASAHSHGTARFLEIIFPSALGVRACICICICIYQWPNRPQK